MGDILLAICCNCGFGWNLLEPVIWLNDQDTAIKYQETCPNCGFCWYRIPANEKYETD